MERSAVNPAHVQDDYRLRFDWGLAGASNVATGAGIAVVIDVLSFTTTLSVALDHGSTVFPYRWKDASARHYADERDAVLAVSGIAVGPGEISLVPQSVRDAPTIERLVLPSPNGSAISFHLAEVAPTVIGASLRNVAAVTTWIDAHFDQAATTVAVIAGGEMWPNGSLRPGVEDLWGAGAVLAGLDRLGWRDRSPEAEVARAAFLAVRDDLPHAMRACASGRELIAAGVPHSVGIAAELDASQTVPVLRDGAFTDAAGPGR